MLYVKRYKNYGKIMSSNKTKSSYDNFYFSFYELSNNRLIELQLIETVVNSKVKSSNLYLYETSYILKSGKEINYYLGQDFFEWFNLSPPFFEIKSSTPPSTNEKNCIRRFFYKYVDKVRHKKTDILQIKS